MKGKLISIILPIYNGEKWIKRCLDSILKQTYKNFEVIIINDGSSDNSLEICNMYASNDSRIKIISKENEGVSKARNKGINSANGEYIQFVDCDDWIEQNACEEMLKCMDKEKSDLVICGLNINKDGKVIRTPCLESKNLYIKKNENDLLYTLKILNSPCNKLYKREKIVCYFDETISLGEDMIFNLNYIQNIAKTSTLNKCLYNVCLDNDNSLNRIPKQSKPLDLLDLYKRELDIYSNFYGNDYDKSFWADRIITSIASTLVDYINYYDKKESLHIIKSILKNEFFMELIANKSLSKKSKIFSKILKFKNTKLVYINILVLNKLMRR